MPNQLGIYLKEGSEDKVDEILEDYYCENFDSILKRLISRYPDRTEIFFQIFEGHKDQKYFLTIPCLLTQVDGICFDTTTKKFFITEKKEKRFKDLPEVAIEFSMISGSISKAFSTPILNKTAINSHKLKIDEFPVKLNRHSILHGVDKNFGTKKNGIKCISLLIYISDRLDLLNRRNIG